MSLSFNEENIINNYFIHTVLMIYGFFIFWREFMDNNIAIIGIIVKNNEKATEINNILHEYQKYIIGRLGLPYRDRNIGVISIIIDSDNNTINALTGKLGRIDGVNVKAMFSKVEDDKK